MAQNTPTYGGRGNRQGARPAGSSAYPQGGRQDMTTNGVDVRAASNLAGPTGAGGGININSQPTGRGGGKGGGKGSSLKQRKLRDAGLTA